MRMRVKVEIESEYERGGQTYTRWEDLFEQILFAEDRQSGSDMVRAIVAVANNLEFHPEWKG